ncbi:Scr1 family TA system antitoxin-like transcriptional regulator [Streptomyces sp. NPDC057494]|uniref:Scr1 family TA system antitoxin-like transcriptional regulator n=1 Tax=Streptomyces sp. NPDC057494 TaxID=3346148 RepID=UPI00368B2D8D
MQIARGLRQLMDAQGLTQGDVARAAEVSSGTVNRYLMWQDRGTLKIPTLRAIAEAAGATAEQTEDLLELARSQADGWWMDTAGAAPWLSALHAFEAVAEYEYVWATSLVPGLAQTPAYARCLHEQQDPDADAAVIDARVQARIRRQQILDREDMRLWIILDQAVLKRRVGLAAVMAEQIDHLRNLAERPRVRVQILPFDVGAPDAGSGGHFLILGRDDVAEPVNSMSVVYLELHRRGLYLDDPTDVTDVTDYKILFDDLRSQAADKGRTLDLLATARSEYDA